MSDGFKVRVPVPCERTGRTVDFTLTLAQAREMEHLLASKRENSKKVRQFLDSMPRNESPDLVVMFRGVAVVLGNVSDKADPSILRMLHDITGSDKFPKPEPKKVKKSGISIEKPSDSNHFDVDLGDG